MSEALFKESYDNSEDKGEEVVGEVVSFLQVKDGKAYAKVRKVGENTTQTVVRQYEEEELDPNPAHDEEKQVAQDTFENIENREAKELMTKMIDEPVKVKHFENNI